MRRITSRLILNLMFTMKIIMIEPAKFLRLLNY